MRRRKRRWHHRRNYAAQHVAIDDFLAAIGWATAPEIAAALGRDRTRVQAWLAAHPERYASAMRRHEGRWRVTYQMRTESTATVLYGTVRAERPEPDLLALEVPEGPYGDPQGRWDLATGKLRRIVRVCPDKLWPPLLRWPEAGDGVNGIEVKLTTLPYAAWPFEPEEVT